MSTPAPDLKSLVDDWLALDPNPETRNEIQSLWDRKDISELDKRLRSRIEFGTAGLRGRMEAGWSRMNGFAGIRSPVYMGFSVHSTSSFEGLAEYVLKNVERAEERGIVIGHDHRYHSEHWAELTALVFATKGMRVNFLQGLNHTPMVPFSVKRLGAACGVMVTASHNPKQDNGYKVYWENAVQIIGPHDTGIADAITANLKPVPFAILQSDLASSPLYTNITDDMRSSYFENLRSLKSFIPKSSQPSIKFVNTSMHGVGDPFAQKMFETFGFPQYIPVKEQQQADPEFPTVKFPNPEEKGALNLALSTAKAVGADYVLAQDPDADRFTAAEKQPDGEWVSFTGDQLGSLFAGKIVQDYKASGKPINKLAIVASTVSSKMIESMAKFEGFKFTECLTGFKFIGNTALNLVDQGYEVPFGYEEAIGYMFGPQIRDKDGVAATAMFTELVLSLRSEGKYVNQYLKELYERYGFFETRNSYFTCNDPKITDEIFKQMRPTTSTPSIEGYPRTLGGLAVTRIIDLTTGFDSGNAPTYKPTLPLSSGHMIQIRASNENDSVNLVLTLRTSGTEPKIKFYLEGKGQKSEVVDSLLSAAITDISDNWIQAGKFGIARA
ncbi:hypothetical protein D9619_005708 [Psilocybe cf. subviscida]|uniref:Phosphoglucomutase n=1 Tax=Psilocybe cf. subviscida TaxID=2480587 RepID=A0A8H5BZ51_9AGAR|nr:hypothetical protein D9619_005708 [Psilocybe cf. subviscida]